MADLPIETSVEESQAAPKKVGLPRLDLVLALAAIFISAVSLAVAIQNSFIQRETLAGSTWPFVQRNLSGGGALGDVTVGISNDGVGPAKIRSIEVYLDGKPVNSTRDLLQRCCGYRSDLPRQQQLARGFQVSIADNTVLRAGESNEMIRVRPSEEMRDIHRQLNAALPRISFRGCYCSVLDKCWRGELATTRIASISACPAPEHPFDPIDK